MKDLMKVYLKEDPFVSWPSERWFERCMAPSVNITMCNCFRQLRIAGKKQRYYGVFKKMKEHVT